MGHTSYSSIEGEVGGGLKERNMQLEAMTNEMSGTAGARLTQLGTEFGLRSLKLHSALTKSGRYLGATARSPPINMGWTGVHRFPAYSLRPTARRASEVCILDSELSFPIWLADLISFNSVMICECLHRDSPSHAERAPSFYRTSTAVKVTIASGHVMSHG